MPVSEMLAQGTDLMLIGMGVVFAFLGVLILSVMLMSRIAHAIHDPEKSGHDDSQLVQKTTPGDISQAELIAVISSAIHRYRNRSG